MTRFNNEVLPLFTENLINSSKALGGPLIDLLVEMAGVLSVMVGPTGPVVLFAKALGSIYHVFNSLPGPLKTTIANIAALGLIMKVSDI